MAAPRPPMYISDIPTLHSHGHPASLGDIDLNRPIEANTPIDAIDLRHAKGVVASLKGKRNAAATQELIELAELRAAAIENAHAAALYTPQNLQEILANIHNEMRGLRDEMRAVRDEMHDVNAGLDDLTAEMATVNTKLDKVTAEVSNI